MRASFRPPARPQTFQPNRPAGFAMRGSVTAPLPRAATPAVRAPSPAVRAPAINRAGSAPNLGGARPPTPTPMRPPQTRMMPKVAGGTPAVASPAAARPTPPRGPPPPQVTGIKRKVDQVSGGVPSGPAAKAADVGKPGAVTTGQAASGGPQPPKGAPPGSRPAMLPKAKMPAESGGPKPPQGPPGTMQPHPKTGSVKVVQVAKQPPVAVGPVGKGGGKTLPSPAGQKGGPAQAAAAADKGAGKAAADKGAGKAGADQGSGKAGADKGAGKATFPFAAADKGAGKAGADQGSGKAGADKGAGKAGADKGAGKAATDKGAGKVGASQDFGAAKGKGGQAKGGVSTPGGSIAEAKDRAQQQAKAMQISVKQRSLEASLKRSLQDFNELPEDNKEGALEVISARFLEQMPAQYLGLLVAQFIAAGVQPAAADNTAENATSGYEVEAAQETAVEAEPAEEAEGGTAEAMAEAMEQFLQKVETQQQPWAWAKAWHELQVPADAERGALDVLLEVAASREGNASEVAPQVLVELARTKKVKLLGSVDLSLQDLAAKLEDLVQVNENAWHLLSNFLLFLFPKTRNSSWGLLYPGWNFHTWWQMTEKVLGAADRFRAFDILVLVLQMMQERSGCVINKQQVWLDAGRTKKVRQVLCTWGEMDEASIIETLSAYGVEL